MANETTITAEPEKLDYFITREFEAPRELVFRAFTDPELVIQWLGPSRLKMTIEKFESIDGGTYRYTHEDQDGNKFFFRGVNHEVLPPERTSAPLSLRDCPNEVTSLCKQRGSNLYPAAGRELSVNPYFNRSLTVMVCCAREWSAE